MADFQKNVHIFMSPPLNLILECLCLPGVQAMILFVFAGKVKLCIFEGWNCNSAELQKAVNLINLVNQFVLFPPSLKFLLILG